MAALRRWPLRRWLAGSWLALVGAVAITAPYLPLAFAPATPDLYHVSVSPAEGARIGHWLGTDTLGRDVLANLVFGTRTIALLSLPAAVLAAVFGGLLGGAAGYWGRTLRVSAPGALLALSILWAALRLPFFWVSLVIALGAAVWYISHLAAGRRRPRWPVPLDKLVLAASAALGTVPRLLLLVAVAAGSSLSPGALLLLFVLTSWASAARLVRAETLRVRALPYIEAALALGLPARQIWWHHIMPAAVRPLYTHLPLSLAAMVALESTLSFLGVGLSPDVASWGRLLSASRLDLSAWWTPTAAMTALVFTTAALRSLASPLDSTAAFSSLDEPEKLNSNQVRN